MTGYARIQGQDGTLAWSWEAKSVNGKGLELRFRLPAGYDFLELAARTVCKSASSGGNVSVSLTIDRSKKDAALVVNEAVLSHYVEVATRWHESAPALAMPSIDGLMALKGVLDVGEEEISPELMEQRGKILIASFEQTLHALAEMRAGEGRRLAEVLRAQLGDITSLVGQAEALATFEPSAVKERLRLQVSALLEAIPALSEERLAQEAALIAAKADIREELDRLKAHLAAAADLLASGEAVGRRLDFLCQEFNREANTLCSKVNDIELTRIGLALKAIIEQFREQVQNIE